MSSESEYVYIDQYGEPSYKVTRDANKGFLVKTPVGDGFWRTGLNGAKPIPYHLPELIRGVNSGQEPWILEGEKDVDTAISLGLLATCNHGGAKKWRDSHSSWLRNARGVNIVWD